MNIPVVPEHKTEKIANGWCPQYPPSQCRECETTNGKCLGLSEACLPDCPACAVEANNKAWAKYLVGLTLILGISEADWEQIKKLAEES